MKRVIMLLCTALSMVAQTTSGDLDKLFENDRNQPGEEISARIDGRPGVRMFDYSFASPVAGRVPGTLVTPNRPGRFPVILYGHWMMKGLP